MATFMWGIAVRACAVMKDQPVHCDANSDIEGQSGDQDAQILLAAKEALKPLPPTSLAVQSAACLTDTNNVDGPQKDIGVHLVQTGVAQSGWDSVTVLGRFRCIVPLASAIVCGDTEKPGNKRFPGFLTTKTEVGREGWIKALRNDVAKIVNHRVFTGDHSSDKLRAYVSMAKPCTFR
jgi:hypothetical protein